MKQPILDFHQDAHQHWIAELDCGHVQHVRHQPPWVMREWVLTAAGREAMLGFELECAECDEGAAMDTNVDWDHNEGIRRKAAMGGKYSTEN